MAEELDPAAVEALFAGTPDRFIASRNDLVERLKHAGTVDAAKEVAALRRPTVAAWAVDTLMRRHADDLDMLIDLGHQLAEAQRGIVTGGDPDRIRETAGERRRLVDRLVRASAQALEDAGMAAPRATLDKVADTLMAIATDEEAAAQVRRGVLEKELPAPAGFGDERLDAALLASVSALPSRSDEAGDVADAKARERAERLDAAATDLEAEAARLEREAERAVAQAASARSRADAARRRADDARL